MEVLKNDFELDVATAHSRLSKRWKNKKWQWSEIVKKCSTTRRTDESVAEYMKMTRDEQSNVKDVGGFVGGYLSGGTRKTENVMWRSMATLDIDYGTNEVWEDFTLQYDCAAMIYSTHKHTAEKPRFRLVIPFSRSVEPKEYEPICRKLADTIGIDLFDTTTYQLPRLFYWPSTPRDGEYIFEYQDGPALDVDAILSTYTNPQDVSEWAIGSRESEAVAHEIRKAGDPLEKPGLIGAFCRAYTIEEAITKFLADKYEATATDGRYTYKLGSVAAGLVCYENKFAYSHHETDPASRQLCNAFDLVRIHLFGLQDEGKRVDDITRLPSYLKMQEFAANDKAVSALLTKEQQEAAESDFADIEFIEEAPGNLKYINANFDFDKAGRIKDTPHNRIKIVISDPNFKAVRYDLFAQRDIIVKPDSIFTGTHPGEVDDTALSLMAQYVETKYQLKTSIGALTDKMLLPTAPEPTDAKPGRGFNPVIEFIGKSEEWDRTPRIETLLIDYLGAEDTPLNRAITRKCFVAAVARAINPGCKFDYCLVLQGDQGIGKSTFISVMAGNWLGSLSLSAGAKEQCETLTASWIVEIPELKGMRQADTDAIKELISRPSDDYRAAYARKRDKNPRHCIFIASTNDNNFLKDATGNRRFWIVHTRGNGTPANWVKQLMEARAQIWREARYYFEQGEKLYLSEELEKQAKAIQSEFTEAAHDPLRDYLQEWLDILIWPNWESYSPERRRAYYLQYSEDDIIAKGSRLRETITICEIRNECPFRGISKYKDNQIIAIIKSLGWEYVNKPKRIGGYKNENGKGNKMLRYYKRPESDPAYLAAHNFEDDESDI